MCTKRSLCVSCCEGSADLCIDLGESVVEGAYGQAAQAEVGTEASGAGQEGVGDGVRLGEVGHPPLKQTCGRKGTKYTLI